MGGSGQWAIVVIFAPVILWVVQLLVAVMRALVYKTTMWLSQKLEPGARVVYIADQLDLDLEKVKELLEWSPELRDRVSRLEDRVTRLEGALEELREKLVTGGDDR